MKGDTTRILIQTIRLATLLLLPVGLVINSLPTTAQTRRATSRSTAPAPANKNIPPASPVRSVQTGPRVQLVRSRKSQTMSQAFANGSLPEPLRMPVGTVDQQAAALAKTVSAGDESSTAALHAAVLAAGFGVRDTDGSVMQTTDRGQGLAFETWEIAVAAKLYGEGYGVTLKHLTDAFTLHMPEMRNAPLAVVLQDGIRAGAASQDSSLRFWARFIVELGRNSEPSYDMLRQADPTKIRLNAVQLSFILKRLLGEVAALDPQTQRAGFDSNNFETSRLSSNHAASNVAFINAGMHVGPWFAKIPSKAQSPCGSGDVGSVILDYNALVSTSLFGPLSEMMGGKLGTYGKAAAYANLILTVLKVFASYALLKTEITIDSHPMVRTKNTEPGERQVLSAKLHVDSDKWQLINCLRPALNLVGLDFNLPASGPVADAGVEWRLIEGGDSRGWIGTIEDFGDIMSGNATWGDGIVSLDPVAGADRSPAKQRTGDDGISRMGIIGVPQAKDMSREKLVKVNKVAGVKVGIQIKTMKISDKVKLISTLGDLGGNVIAFLTGDVVGGVIGTGAETLYRSHWYSSDPFYFIVNDWEPCAGLWQGTMTTTTSHESHMVDTNESGDYVKKHDSSYRFDATVKFEGAKATATIDVEETISSDQKSGYGRITYHQKRFATYSGEVRAEASVSSGRYSVSFELPRFSGTYQSSGSCERPAPYKCQQPASISKPWQFNDGRYLSHLGGVIDPNKPNEISDTKTLGEPEHLQHKLTVNMKRCQ